MPKTKSSAFFLTIQKSQQLWYYQSNNSQQQIVSYLRFRLSHWHGLRDIAIRIHIYITWDRTTVSNASIYTVTSFFSGPQQELYPNGITYSASIDVNVIGYYTSLVQKRDTCRDQTTALAHAVQFVPKSQNICTSLNYLFQIYL